MKIEAHAKINWTLEVLGTRPDGYHELKSIVLPVALSDELEFIPGGAGFRIEGCGDIPLERNLIYKAAAKLGLRPVTVRVRKRIPSGAGLGGGSADAAATLRALNELWNLGLSEARLVELAAEVGSDVPALLLDAPVMMEGRGERVRRLEAAELAGVPKSEEIELLTPPVFASTPAVYREFREEDRGQGRNDLQPAALRLYPEIAAALEELRARGLKEVAMSGSGSTVYGIRPKPNRD